MIKQLEKLKQGSISFQPQEAARRLIIHRLCLSALALPAPGGAEEAAALPALSVRLFPRPSPAGGAAPPRPRLRPSPAAGRDRAPRSAAGPDPRAGAARGGSGRAPAAIGGSALEFHDARRGGARGCPGPGAAPSHSEPVFSSGNSAVGQALVSPERCSAAPALPLAALACFKRVRNTAGRTTGYCLTTAHSGTQGKTREGKTIPVIPGFAPSFNPR